MKSQMAECNREHLRRLRTGVGPWNRWRKTSADIPALEGVRLQGLSASGIDLNGANLPGASFHAVDLSAANLSGANLSYASFFDCDLEGTNFQEATLASADIRGGTLSGALFRGALVHSSFSRVRMRSTDFKKANLEAALFRSIDFTGAEFADACFGRTTFVNCRLAKSQGLNRAGHRASSSLDFSTLMNSPHLPTEFLRGCGLPEQWIGLLPRLCQQANGLPSCFISYSHQDKAFAKRLHHSLQSRGVRCWLDDHDLKPGDRILDAVAEAIRMHDTLLLCCSEASLTSWWVKDEIRKALERERMEERRIIVPVLLDNYLIDQWSDGLASELRSRLGADFAKWKGKRFVFETALKRLIGAIHANDSTS